MADANRESFGFIKEVTFGTNPGGTKQLLNLTSNSLAQSNEETNSKFLRSDTNVAGTVRTGVTAGGATGIELQYGAYDSLLESAYRGIFPTAFSVTATDISVAASNTVNAVVAAFANVVVGQWIKISGFATQANNGYFKVLTKPTSNQVTLAGGTMVIEAAGASVTMKGTVLSNSTTKASYTLERNFEDITQFLLFTGMRVSEMGFNFATKDIANGSISFIGQDGTSSTTSGFSGSTAVATTPSMNTFTDIKAIFIDNVLSTLDFTNIDFTINTNSEALDAIGTTGITDVRQGSIGVTGNLGIYFEDASLLTKAYAFTAIDLAFVTEDSLGNGYIWHFPSTRINGTPENQGINTTTVENYSFTSTLDSTLGYTASVSRFVL